MGLQIGGVRLKNCVLAAPMAGVTDKAFRILAKEAGCGLVYTEMISDKALVFGNRHTIGMLNLEGEEKPLAVQIFGSEPAVMAQAARIVAEEGADIIDINMGCPTPKIIKNGEGSALMRCPEQATEIAASVVAAVKVPVTVKMRRGWDDAHQNALELALLLEKTGVAAVTIHGRTRDQFYSGKADRQVITDLRRMLKIPIIGNGDIWEPEDAQRMLQETGCAGVMIGRGSMGNPWLFSRTVALLEGRCLTMPTPVERITMAIRHFHLLIEFKGADKAVREMRKHAAWYLKGLRDAARLREKVNQINTVGEFGQVLETWLETYS